MDEKELSLASMKSELRRVEEEHEKILYSEKEAVKVMRNNFQQIFNCEHRQILLFSPHDVIQFRKMNPIPLVNKHY